MESKTKRKTLGSTKTNMSKRPGKTNAKRICKEKVIKEKPVWIEDSLEKGCTKEENFKTQIFQNGICRCCLSKGYFKSMELPNSTEEIKETYAALVEKTLGLNLTRWEVDRLICNMCEIRLKDSVIFRKQVMKAEMEFLSNVCEKSKEGKMDNDDFITENREDVNLLRIECNEIPSDDLNMNYIMPVEVKIEISSDSDDDIPLSRIPATKSELCDDKTKIKKEKRKDTTFIVWVKCDHCTKRFKNKHRQEKHKIKTHLSCKVCQLKFDSILEKNEHVLLKHPFFCEYCKVAFATSEQKFKHINGVHGRKCTLCDKRFMQRALLRHKVQVHNADMVQCKICDRKFYTKSDLIMHQRKIHMNEKNVPCLLCDHVAFDGASLGKHMTTHDEKKLECRFCLKKFSRLTHLDYHERIHTGDKRKVCKICGKAFVQRASLKYHLEKYHPKDFY